MTLLKKQHSVEIVFKTFGQHSLMDFFSLSDFDYINLLLYEFMPIL